MAKDRLELKEAQARQILAEDRSKLPGRVGEVWAAIGEANAVLLESVAHGSRSQALLQEAKLRIDQRRKAFGWKIERMARADPIAWARDHIPSIVWRSGIRLELGITGRVVEDLLEGALQSGALAEAERQELRSADFLGIGCESRRALTTCVALGACQIVEPEGVLRAKRNAELWLQAVKAATAAKPEAFSRLLPKAPERSVAIIAGAWMSFRCFREIGLYSWSNGMRFQRVPWPV